MVLDYAGRKTSSKKPKSKLIGRLVIVACFIIIALLILQFISLHRRKPAQSIKMQTTTDKNQQKTQKHNKVKALPSLTQQQPEYDFYTLLPKMSGTPSRSL